MIIYLRNSNHFKCKYFVVTCKTTSYLSYFFHVIINFEVESSSINKNQSISMSYVSSLLSPQFELRRATYNRILITYLNYLCTSYTGLGITTLV
jgi:hypothetical protein